MKRSRCSLFLAPTLLAASCVTSAAPDVAPTPESGQTAAATALRQYGSLQFSPCTLSAQLSTLNVDAYCSHLEVPENREAPDGRKISLAIAWIASDNTQAAPDPVFFIAGGPGQSALESYPQVHTAFREVLKHHQVVLVDQRGTGGSNPLVCKDADGANAIAEEDAATDPTAWRDFAERCANELGEHADLRFYTTTDATADLDAVREALGVAQINLLGVSYGTRVAQQFLQHYPQSTRSVVLDSVVPNTLILGAEHARNLEASLDQQFALCGENSVCRERFGNPRERLNALVAELRTAPRVVSYRDPLTAELREENLTAGHVALLARMYAYMPSLGGSLPLVLSEAANGHAEPMIAQAKMLGESLTESIMHGMQLSVLCAEDEPLLQADPADADRLLGLEMVTLTKEQCAVWPRGRMPEDFHNAVSSDTATLILSGEFDPVTPPRYGDEVVKTLSRGRHLILRGQGHSVASIGCMPRLLGEFFKSADAQALDASCLDTLKATQPFAGYYGWEP